FKGNDFSFLYWFLFLILPLGLLLCFGTLKVQISPERIKYSMFPFVDRELPWSEIENYEVDSISPLGDFGGWGIRYSRKYGWSYIRDTNYVIAIKKKNRKKISLSINDREKLLAYLNSIGK